MLRELTAVGTGAKMLATATVYDKDPDIVLSLDGVEKLAGSAQHILRVGIGLFWTTKAQVGNAILDFGLQIG